MSVERRKQRTGGMEPGPMGRGGWGAMSRPVEKAKDFQGTLKRLLGYFLPQKYRLLIVLATAIVGTVFNIVGPKILGLATTKLFAGLSDVGCVPHLFVRRVLLAVADIAGNRSRKEDGLLRHKPDFRA